MNAQRFLAWLLIVVQAAALAVQSETVLFPAAIVLAGLAGAVSTRRLRLTSEQALRAAGVLALIFYAKYLIAPHAVPFDRLFIRTQLALAIGQYLLVMQVAQLFLLRTSPERTANGAPGGPGGRGPWLVDVKGRQERLSAVLPGLGVVAMICFAAVRVSSHERLIYQLLAVSFVLFAALYFCASRRMLGGGRSAPLGRAVASGAALIAVAAAAWWASETLFTFERSIERFISELLSPSQRQSGFSLDGGLGSVSRHRDTHGGRLALLVVADRPPGYLRGQSFDQFRRRQWQSTPARHEIGAALLVPPGIAASAGARSVFQLDPAATPDDGHVQEVWPAASLSERLFHPLGTTYVAAEAPTLSVDGNGNLQAREMLPADPYLVIRTPAPQDEPPAGHYRRSLTALPDAWEGEAPDEAGLLARRLAEEIFAECRTTAERIEAVEAYFRSNYGYSVEATVLPGEDALTWFLRNRPDAYCEYFATAAALLLREAGVPARYVTGFVVTERHRFGDYWVARNRHAHAWVEAWDDERGWVIVEATPGAGVPEPAPPVAAVQLWEYMANGLRRFRAEVGREGWTALAAGLAAFVTSVPGIVLLLAGAAWIALRVRRRERRRRAGPDVPPAHRRLHRLLARMERKLKRYGWERAEGETLHQFAARLAEAGDAGDGSDADVRRAQIPANSGHTPRGEMESGVEGRHGREVPGVRGGLVMESAEEVADWYLRYAAVRYSGRVAVEPAVVETLLPLPEVRRRGGQGPDLKG